MPPKERIDALANRVLEDLKNTPRIEVEKAGEAKAIFRARLIDNLAEERKLEEEVLETLRAHGQKLYEQDVDFQKMFHEGKKMLARKKGFTL